MPDIAATHVIHAPADWRCVGVVSDLHLQATAAETAAAWHQFLAQASPTTGFDALFILGDYFELWVGDDALEANPLDSAETPFWLSCVSALKAASARLPIYMAVGNRDFLLSDRFFEASGVTALPENTLLDWGTHRYLMVHGDAWCVSDVAYQAFRALSRTAEWQDQFLGQPLTQRLALAAEMRAQSQAYQAAQSHWFDVDVPTLATEAHTLGATDVIHGHTHRPGDTPLQPSGMRIVLSDWDATACPPRTEVLRLSATGHQRMPLARG